MDNVVHCGLTFLSQIPSMNRPIPSLARAFAGLACACSSYAALFSTFCCEAIRVCPGSAAWIKESGEINVVRIETSIMAYIWHACHATDYLSKLLKNKLKFD